MNRCCKWNYMQFVLGLTLTMATVTVFVSCSGAPTPAPVVGPGLSGNDPPTLQITEPNADVTADQGANFLIRWIDSDPDDNAAISFSLVNTETNQVIVLVTGVDENDSTGPDTFTVNTALLPIGTYNLRGTIDDGVNGVVTIFSETTSANITQRTVIRIVEPGRGQQTIPPVVTVTEPAFNQSVAQDDILRVTVQPTDFDPIAALPFDPDSAITLFVLLDIDLDPDNDDPTNPDSSQIIVLQTRTVEAGSFEAINFDIEIDLTTIPPRTDGEPYFIRVTADDLTNPRVHQYAVGTISVAQLAAGTVDLFDIGRAISGVRFYGFNPGAQLGSSMSTLTDFDLDGVDDFTLVAQFGNPRNFGLIGEAYTIYGQDRVRFGGSIGVNSVGEAIGGVIFSAPPLRTNIPEDFAGVLDARDARTDGITTVSVMSDLSGDGRPEILFGLQHVNGAFDAMDYDPGDDDADEFNPFGCYPDTIVNNLTTDGDGLLADTYYYSGGMALIVNSQNRDNDGFISNRLESTVVDLELVGARVVPPLDNTGFDVGGAIFARADNDSAVNVGNETSQPGRISGARFFPGGFDFIDPFGQDQGPREGLFGETVSRLGDLNADGLDEIMVSAPTNEAYTDSLLDQFGFGSTQWRSTLFRASITVFPGTNYNLNLWRDKADDQNGTSNTPQLDQSGKCSSTVDTQEARGYVIPADTFGVFAEDTSDFLGGAVSAGDFNQDGIDDILCGAPLNNLSASVTDTGAAYVIYGRNVPGDVLLRNADDPFLRVPTLRIRGVKTGDQVGFTQVSGLDVNGDRISDIFIASPATDFGPIRKSSCAGDFDGDGDITQNDLDQLSFDLCKDNEDGRVFTDESCKAFDYDNNGIVDEGDSEVFSCLISGGADCCDTVVDNGFVAAIFGGVFLDGDRTIDQIATSELPGVVFFGSASGHRAGTTIASAGDFNQDGFGDLLITAPGEVRIDSTGRERLGVVYLIFGGPHLENTVWNLNQVASADLPGIVFLSPYAIGRPNEAAPVAVAGLGDINNDGFDDIAIGNPKADFIDLSFPQGPDATDAELGRRRDTGDVYIVYGNNFGSNR